MERSIRQEPLELYALDLYAEASCWRKCLLLTQTQVIYIEY